MTPTPTVPGFQPSIQGFRSYGTFLRSHKTLERNVFVYRNVSLERQVHLLFSENVHIERQVHLLFSENVHIERQVYLLFILKRYLLTLFLCIDLLLRGTRREGFDDIHAHIWRHETREPLQNPDASYPDLAVYVIY